MRNDENWKLKYTALREHVEAHGHLTDRHTQLNHWWKYQKKKRKEGKLTEEQCRMLDELMGLRTLARMTHTSRILMLTMATTTDVVILRQAQEPVQVAILTPLASTPSV